MRAQFAKFLLSVQSDGMWNPVIESVLTDATKIIIAKHYKPSTLITSAANAWL